MPVVAAHELTADQMDTAVYNGMDSCVTMEIFQSLSAQIPQAEPMYSFERALQAPVMEMQLRGLKVDPFAREEGIDRLVKRLEHLSRFIDVMAETLWAGTYKPPVSKPGKDKFVYPKPKLLNPESSQQLCKIFYERLNVPKFSKWEDGVEKFPMDRDVLEKIENYFRARPLANAIMEYRDTVGQLEVFTTEVDNDWRMRTTYQIAGTDTTRFSSSKSITGSGRNLQNVEEGLRYIFTADPGWTMYGIDLEQTESREVGLICGLLFDDWTYLDACESGDLHTTVARLCFTDLPWTGDKKLDREIADGNFYRHYSYRDACKKLGHGSNYFGQPDNMANQTKIPVGLVGPFQQRYFERFPAIPLYHQWVAEQLQTKSRLTNVFGVTRDFFGRSNSADTLRAAIASLPQSATAQRLNLGLWRVWRHMPHIQLLAQLHDAIYFQAPSHLDPKIVARQALDLMEIRQILPNGRKFIIPGEAKAGLNWGSRKEDKKTGEVTNPKGLVKIKF